ncbi:MAG: aminotransferase class I/II-fold pyridoxal phosphate-dependent enzyme [Luteibaculum sp.]
MSKTLLSIEKKLAAKNAEGSLRSLPELLPNGIDFCSNDYLGLAKKSISELNSEHHWAATGSRLISGNSNSILEAEKIATVFFGQDALLFNSGYHANVALIPCLSEADDVILYDAHSHMSFRDGIKLSAARAFSFQHNNLEHLEERLKQVSRGLTGKILVISEGLFSMQGDQPDLETLLKLCEKYQAELILDEAHSAGIFGEQGRGLSYEFREHPNLLLRIFPLGKSFAAAGCFVVANKVLLDYVVNQCRTFIYSTALPPVMGDVIGQRIIQVEESEEARKRIFELISFWCQRNENMQISQRNSPIQFVLANREKQLRIKEEVIRHNINVLPIRYPSVPKAEEGFRVTLHSFNTEAEIIALQNLLNPIC